MFLRLYVANGQIHGSELHAYDDCGSLHPPEHVGKPSVLLQVSQVATVSPTSLQQMLDAHELTMTCKKCLMHARIDFSRNKALVDAVADGESVPVVHPVHGPTRISVAPGTEEHA